MLFFRGESFNLFLIFIDFMCEYVWFELYFIANKTSASEMKGFEQLQVDYANNSIA